MKKKILIFIQSLRIGGGAERIISYMTQKLSKKYNFHILTIQDYKNLYPINAKYKTINEKSHSSIRELKSLLFYSISRPFRIYKHIKLTSPDILISFLEFPNIYSIITKFLFRIKIPLIISIRCNPRLHYKEELRYLNFLIRALYPSKLVNKVITNSKGVEKILENDYKITKTKLKTIYNGIDLERINEMKYEKIFDHPELFYNNDVKKFITVGRLTKGKGHSDLIEAFSKVKDELPHSKLIIIGEGPLREELEKQIKIKGLKDDVFLLGSKKNPYKYLANSNIFVFSSKYEGFPNVLLEALACGLPIISTDCETGPREILEGGKNGFLIDIMDKEDLSSKMLLLARNEKLMKKYSKLSLERAEFFKINKLLKEWVELIEKVSKINKINFK